jgi:hypothetical protein
MTGVLLQYDRNGNQISSRSVMTGAQNTPGLDFDGRFATYQAHTGTPPFLSGEVRKLEVTSGNARTIKTYSIGPRRDHVTDGRYYYVVSSTSVAQYTKEFSLVKTHTVSGAVLRGICFDGKYFIIADDS